MLKVTPDELYRAYRDMMDANQIAYETMDEVAIGIADRCNAANDELRGMNTELLFDVEGRPDTIVVVYARQSGYGATAFTMRDGRTHADKEFGWYKTESGLMRAIKRGYKVDFDKPIAETGMLRGKMEAGDILCGRGC